MSGTEARLTGLNRQEALIYLNYKGGAIPPDVDGQITRCESLVMQTAEPRLTYRRFDVLPDGSLAGTEFRPLGNDVKELLSTSVAVIVFAATLGTRMDALIRRKQIAEMSDAVILDACASAAIENVCDNFCADIADAEKPMYLTDRFSPGYGDLPFSQQPEFCRLLDVERRIGVTLSPGGLMNPQKSVTALFGISPELQKKRFSGCANCTLFSNCAYRKGDTTCGR